MKKSLINNPAIPYALPFGLFLLLTGAADFLPNSEAWLYPLKTLLVGLSAWFCLKGKISGQPARSFALTSGVFVFIIWIMLEGTYPLLSGDSTYDPYFNLGRRWAVPWVMVRIFGATVVVSIIEELFWRGFLLRWIIDADFEKVEHGAFTWKSFLLTTVLFGFEHHRWLAGIFAGIAYNVLYYRTKSLRACVIAHAVTNFMLGLYVVHSGEWKFW